MDHLIGIYGLIFKCPFQVEDKQCPFWSIRQKEIRAKIEFVNEMNEEQIIKLYDEHLKCFAIKNNR
jgi:hypothetical protein